MQHTIQRNIDRMELIEKKIMTSQNNPGCTKNQLKELREDLDVLIKDTNQKLKLYFEEKNTCFFKSK
jgi:hypothetical protein